MLETFFDRSFAIDRLRQSPLAGHIDLLANRSSTEGYSRIHSRIQLRYIGHFNRWLDRKGLTAKQIDEEMIERFWHSFMRRKKVRRGGVYLGWSDGTLPEVFYRSRALGKRQKNLCGAKNFRESLNQEPT